MRHAKEMRAHNIIMNSGIHDDDDEVNTLEFNRSYPFLCDTCRLAETAPGPGTGIVLTAIRPLGGSDTMAPGYWDITIGKE